MIVDTLPADAILDPVAPSGPRWLAGLDLGQTTDYTALSIGERIAVPTGRYRDTEQKRLIQMQFQMPRPASVFHREERHDLHIRFLKRFELRTDYVVMAAQVKEWMGQLPPGPAKPVLLIDHTGVGRGVFDIFRHAGLGIPLIGVTFTGGQEAKQNEDHPWEWTVPKKDLVSALQVMLQGQRLKVAPGLPEGPAFIKEMQTFRMTVKPNATVTYEAAREGDHDDLVLSVSLVCWGNEVLLAQRGGIIL